MTNKEALVLAAKACGFSLKEFPFNHNPWNPIEVDSDCARLEAHLLIDIYWGISEVECVSSDGEHDMVAVYTEFNGDKNAARRHASTMVAALIGANIA